MTQIAQVKVEGADILIETDSVRATVRTEGYVSGVAGGTFLDKRSGAKDLGFGLAIVDFLLEPGSDDEAPVPVEDGLRYHWGDLVHGNIKKRYVELPQICTQAKKLPYEIVEGKNFVAVKQWFHFTIATQRRKPGSLWEQWLLFPEGKRYFYACDKVTSANDVEALILRIDMPGHLKHQGGDSFEQIYLSYHGFIEASEFLQDFPPDARFLYQRGKQPLPNRFIRAYKIRQAGANGPWLAGMTLDSGIVYEGWCHQRGYVCFIQEIGGFPVKVGQSFSAAYIVGFFDSVEEVERTYDEHKGARWLKASKEGYDLQ